MNYIRIYNEIIVNAIFRDKPLSYTEKHHIIPKCIGGTNDKTNLVILTGKEHFIVHHLLTKIFPTNTKLFFAFNAMCGWKSKNTKNRYKPNLSATEYEKLKTKRSITISNYFKGKPKSEEQCKKISQSLTGKKLSKATKEKLSIAQKKVVHTAEWNKKVGLARKNYKFTDEHCYNISKSKKGKHINYNMNSAGFHGTQSGIDNYQAIKCYVNDELIGCIKDLRIWLKNNYINSSFRHSEPWDYIKNNNYHINTDEYEMILLECMNKYKMMQKKKEILNKIKAKNIKTFLANNELIFLKKYIGNTQVEV